MVYDSVKSDLSFKVIINIEDTCDSNGIYDIFRLLIASFLAIFY
jgi:hypothetical protein